MTVRKKNYFYFEMYQCYGNDVNDLFDCYLQLYEEA